MLGLLFYLNINGAIAASRCWIFLFNLCEMFHYVRCRK